MTQAGPSRTRNIAFALVAAVVAALGLYRWIGSGEPPTAPPFRTAPAPTALGSEPARAAVRPTSPAVPPNAREPNVVPAAPLPTEPSSQARQTPAASDLATIPRADGIREGKGEERFHTNERFTEEDLQDPEIYFLAAERMPELNRPEERRDTLDFFLAYREKLGQDLEAVGENPDKRQAILATIERYDKAITRLRKLVDAEGAK